MGWDDVKKKQPRLSPHAQDRNARTWARDYADLAFNPRYEKQAAPLSKRRNGYYSGVDKSKGGFYGIDQKEATALAVITPLAIIVGGVYFAGSALLRSEFESIFLGFSRKINRKQIATRNLALGAGIGVLSSLALAGAFAAFK